jgi:hypothetical protein
VHAPFPSVLVFVGSYNSDYLLNPEMAKLSDSDKNRVQILIFAVSSLAKHFSYQGRDIATPYLSCLNLEDPINDWRLLGNTVYSPGINRYNPWSFNDFFTGSEELGFYELDTSQYGRNFRYLWQEYYLSRYVGLGYYVVDLISQKRISEFFNKYEEAEEFAKKLYYGVQSEVEGIRFVRSKPYNIFLKLNVINAGVRKISHPIGFFSYVKTKTGIIYVSELFSLFRNILICGGEVID